MIALSLVLAPVTSAWAAAQMGRAMAIAAEMNAGATAFVEKQYESLRLRWFSVAAELELCGHGTLATAHGLWESGRLAAGEAGHA